MFNIFETKKETLWEKKEEEENQKKYAVPLILIILLFVASILLLPGCSADKKDAILGTYQLTDADHDSYFIVFEETEEKNKYRLMYISVKENSDKANVFNQGIVTLDAQEKNVRVIGSTGAIIGEYAAENKLLNFTNTTYKKISDKKLNAEEMKKLVTMSYQSLIKKLIEENKAKAKANKTNTLFPELRKR